MTVTVTPPPTVTVDISKTATVSRIARRQIPLPRYSQWITGQSHHPAWGIVVRSIQQRSRLNLGPRRCLLPQQGRHRAHHHLGTHDGCMKAIRHAWQDETDRPSYQLIGQSTSSSPATRGQQVQDLDEPAIMRLIDIIHIIRIMDIMRIIDIICITLSAWVSVLNPIFQKMSSIK